MRQLDRRVTSAARTLEDVLALTEFSTAAYLATVPGWHKTGNEKFADLLADRDLERQRVCNGLYEMVQQLGGTRKATCFPLGFATLNDLDLESFMPQVVAWSTTELAQLTKYLAQIDPSSPAYPTALASVRFQCALIEDLLPMSTETPQIAITPHPCLASASDPHTITVVNSDERFTYSPPSITIQVAIDIGRTFVMPVPTDCKPIDRWRQVLTYSEDHLPDQIIFKQFSFHENLRSSPTPLGWMCSTPLQTADLGALVSILKSLELDLNSVCAELILFTTGLGFLVIRANMPTPPNMTLFGSQDILRLIRSNELGLSKRLAKYAYSFIKRITLFKFSEFHPLHRPSLDRSRPIKILGSYVVLFVPASEFNALGTPIHVSDTPSDIIDLLLASGPPLTAQVGWEFAKVWPSHNERIPVNDHYYDLDLTILAANVAWFGFVIMDEFVTNVAEHMFVNVSSRKSRHIPDLPKVRLAYLQAADAMNPIRWTRWNPHLGILTLIHTVWETAKQWKSVEERVQLLEAAHRQSVELRLALAGLSLTTMAVISAVADVYGLFQEEKRWWPPWLAIALGAVPFAGALVYMLYYHIIGRRGGGFVSLGRHQGPDE